MQVDFTSAEGKTLTLQSQFGGQLAGGRMKMKSVAAIKEIRGAVWHNWSWLQDRGLPRNMEVQQNIQVFTPYIISLNVLTEQMNHLFSPRACAPSRESSLSCSPGLSSLWMDTSCSTRA